MSKFIKKKEENRNTRFYYNKQKKIILFYLIFIRKNTLQGESREKQEKKNLFLCEIQ